MSSLPRKSLFKPVAAQKIGTSTDEKIGNSIDLPKKCAAFDDVVANTVVLWHEYQSRVSAKA